MVKNIGKSQKHGTAVIGKRNRIYTKPFLKTQKPGNF